MMTIVFMLLMLGGAGAQVPDNPSQTRGAPGFWILTCDMTAAGPVGVEEGGRGVFRLGPKSFQQWKPAQRAFGSNLCRTFACVADRDRLEGTISAASVILTIKLDRQTRAGSWQTVGASGLTRSSGSCTVRPDGPPSPGG